MIDKYKYCTTKSKLTIKVKTVSKYNDRSRVAAKQTNKQTQKHRTGKELRQKNVLKEQKDILTNRRRSRQTVGTNTDGGK